MKPSVSRRIWIWSVILACLAAAVVVALFLLSNEAPFRFLAGHQPVPFGPMPADMAYDPKTDVFYSFKADYNHLRRMAADELDPMGFRKDTDLMGPTWTTWRRGEEGITIMTNTRLEEVSEKGFDSDADPRGWVRIHIVGNPTPSVWRRLIALLGF